VSVVLLVGVLFCKRAGKARKVPLAATPSTAACSTRQQTFPFFSIKRSRVKIEYYFSFPIHVNPSDSTAADLSGRVVVQNIHEPHRFSGKGQVEGDAGMRYFRRFESGTKVEVDLLAHSAKITWAQ
jgi:hypothetical protein